MNPSKLRFIGNTPLQVTQFGMGGAVLGNLFDKVGEGVSTDTIAAAYDAGVRYFDTAPLYGNGLSEKRMGNGLAPYDRDEIVISTKVGWSLEPRDPSEMEDGAFIDPLPFEPVMNFSRDAVLRSLDESLERLSTDRIDIWLIHDPDEGLSVMPDHGPYDKSHFQEAMDEAYPILDDLRSQGVVKAIGSGMNQWQMLYDLAMAGDFDCFLLAGRYTLLEQESLGKLLPVCDEKNISIIIGGPYNSGILATGAIDGAYYNYTAAPREILERTRKIEEVCARHNVSLQAAALQFPFGHPAVSAVIPGARSVEEIESNIGYFKQDIPADFWAELKSRELINPEAPVPDGKQ